MSIAPALVIRADRQGAWRLGVATLLTLSTAAALAWWASRGAHAPAWSAIALLACLLAIGCAALGLRAGPASALRWDGRSWWFSSGNERALAGDVGVAIDLGAWMLLRFVPQVRRGRWRTRWVSLQRRGLEGEWHALRCIVHAARTNEASVA